MCLWAHLPPWRNPPKVWYNRDEVKQCETMRMFYGIYWKHNRSISHIPQCTSSISHNAPFKTEMCTFLYVALWDMEQVYCGICELDQYTDAIRPLWCAAIGSGNDLPPVRCQAITRTNWMSLKFESKNMFNFSQNQRKFYQNTSFSHTIMHLSDIAIILFWPQYFKSYHTAPSAFVENIEFYLTVLMNVDLQRGLPKASNLRVCSNYCLAIYSATKLTQREYQRYKADI